MESYVPPVPQLHQGSVAALRQREDRVEKVVYEYWSASATPAHSVHRASTSRHNSSHPVAAVAAFDPFQASVHTHRNSEHHAHCWHMRSARHPVTSRRTGK